jgi:hypothetical protein
MATIEDEIAAFEPMQEQLEADHMGEWILMKDRQKDRDLSNLRDGCGGRAAFIRPRFVSSP